MKPGKPAAPVAKVFQCPNCGAGIVVHAVGQTISAACGACGSIIDVKDENLAILQKAATATRVKPLIPLGQKGKIHGHTWMCIGMMQRLDPQYEQFSWREYLLFNPQQGYRWLVEFDGHWSYVVRMTEEPKRAYGGRVKAFGKSYRLYNSGNAKVNYVIGEFYWRVKVNETVKAVDYVFPPEMLSLEESDGEQIWSVGEYTEPDVIQKAFQINDPMPPRIGVSPNQPSPAGARSSHVGGWAMAFILVLTIMQFLVIFMSAGENVLGVEYFHSPLSPRGEVSPPFEVKSLSNVEISLAAPVSNSWLETNIDLIDEKTGESASVDIGVEYYSGYDSDGSWSEGSTHTSKIVSSVPEGKYHLVITPSSEGTPSQPADTAGKTPEVRRENYPDGKLKAEEPYIDGKIEGMAHYYHPDGKLLGSIPFRRGNKHGKFTLYRPDGSKEQELSYKDGQLHGTLRWFDQQGRITNQKEYRNGNDTPNEKSTEISYAIRVRRDVATWSNFLWSVFILSLFPLWAGWRSRSFEMARWANSDYSPYASSD